MSKRKTALVVVFVMAALLSLGLAAAVYAKYISSITKTGTASVAKWAFNTDNTEGEVSCTLDATYDSDTLVANKIAPGTSGKCPIELSNANTEVGVHYEITPSDVVNPPKNLKFFTDAAHHDEISSSNKIEGDLAPKDATVKTVYVYWYWPYEDTSDDTYDSKDTADGVSASTMTMTFDVSGTQIEPSI